MKMVMQKEVVMCDHCKKEGYVTACLSCGTEHCWECKKTQGHEYSHGVYLGGSGDGYYCRECDVRLTSNGGDAKHSAYRAINSLRLEQRAWGEDFDRRKSAAENALQQCKS